MDTRTALAFLLTRDYLNPVMPAHVHRSLKPYFEKAENTLTKASNPSFVSWSKKIRYVARGYYPQGPTAAPGIYAAVTNALFENKRLLVTYENRRLEVKEYLLSPLALVIRGDLPYLIAHFEDSGCARTFASHRIRTATVQSEPADPLPDFSLDEFIESGELGIPVSYEEIRLKLKFSSAAALGIRDSQVAVDQNLRNLGDGGLILEATVPDTVELRSWILGYGADIEVLGPKELRDYIAGELKTGAKLYHSFI